MRAIDIRPLLVCPGFYRPLHHAGGDGVRDADRPRGARPRVRPDQAYEVCPMSRAVSRLITQFCVS